VDLVGVPYLVSADLLDRLVRAGPEAFAAFLDRQVRVIEEAWRTQGRAEAVSLASAALLSQVEAVEVPCTPLARLLIVHADASLAVASAPGLVRRALASAERAQEVLAKCRPTDETLELLSEALLMAGVALKALDRFDESIDRMRSSIVDWRLDEIGAVALIRQEAMMFQSLERHVGLLRDAGAYRRARPREYFRTTRRALEILMNGGEHRAADALAPHVTKAFVRAGNQITYLARVSFLKNLGQLLGARRETHRARRMLLLCLGMAGRSGFAGQEQQIRRLLQDLRAEGELHLVTFKVPSEDVAT
jgi:hypothetical protein